MPPTQPCRFHPQHHHLSEVKMPTYEPTTKQQDPKLPQFGFLSQDPKRNRTRTEIATSFVESPKFDKCNASSFTRQLELCNLRTMSGSNVHSDARKRLAHAFLFLRSSFVSTIMNFVSPTFDHTRYGVVPLTGIIFLFFLFLFSFFFFLFFFLFFFFVLFYLFQLILDLACYSLLVIMCAISPSLNHQGHSHRNSQHSADDIPSHIFSFLALCFIHRIERDKEAIVQW
jgi:hypothetical protein